MCGINVLIDKQKLLTSTQSIEAMNDAIQHRGTEASSFLCLDWQNQQCFVGHNRLKILDLSNEANQPFVSSCGRYVLVFNGEIYNYQALKAKLPAQIQFKTHSDTEILLHFLITFGLHNLDELNGIFAFIWIDNLQKKYYAIRDRFGVKPLYKFENEQFIIISSEIKGILATKLVPKKLNEAQISHYLTYKFAKFPQTFFKEIEEVSPYQPTQRVENEQFETLNKAKIIQKVASLLKQSLALQWQADVPVALMLSGGIDSTLLLALSQELGYQAVDTFTLVSEKSSFGTNDTHFASLAVRQFQAKAHEVVIKPDLLNHLAHFATLFDQPIADSAAWLTYLICQEAKTQFKVLLSGAGADELFAGYNRHQAFSWVRKNWAWLKRTKPLLGIAQFFLLDGLPIPFRKKSRLIKKMIRLLKKLQVPDFRFFTQLSTLSTDYLPLKQQHFDIKQALAYEQTHFLRQDVLKITDNFSMLNTIEVRVPYLDNNLANFMQNLPSHWFEGSKKWILKDILTQKNGSIYTQRPKEGFGFPLGEWLKAKEGKVWLQWFMNEKLLLDEFIPKAKSKVFITQHLQHRADYCSEIWALLILALWLEHHFK